MKKLSIMALSGPVKGKTFDLKNGLVFGRAAGDVMLQDLRVSSPHAEIKIYKSGQIMLIDRNSKNGIEVNGEKKAKSILSLKTRFSIGVSEFEVIAPKSPEEACLNILKKHLPEFEDEKQRELSAFFKPLELKFLKGPQAGVLRFLAYGPRFFGSESVDGPLFDAAAPGDSFALRPSEGGILFETKHPEIININGEAAPQKAVQSGDIVSFGGSEIKISFVS